MKPSENPAFTQKIDGQKQAYSKAVLLKYMDKLHELIAAAMGSGKKVDIDDVLSAFPDVAPGTIKKYLKKYLDTCPDDLLHITGFYPAKETLIAMAESRLGPVNGQNLSETNELCKSIVESISKPRHARFLASQLASHIKDGMANIPVDLLVNLLFDEYVSFIRESDNGLVSIAGSLNEAIFIRGLLNEGLQENEDVVKTGTDSDGDLKIQHHGKKGAEVLFVEIKSYAARERLLRGLQDIKSQNKIGVGFFNNPAEFNPKRTNTLLAADPLAIYMPRKTWDKVPEDSRRKANRVSDYLYRPLDMFVADMKAYVKTGKLPVFNSF